MGAFEACALLGTLGYGRWLSALPKARQPLLLLVGASLHVLGAALLAAAPAALGPLVGARCLCGLGAVLTLLTADALRKAHLGDAEALSEATESSAAAAAAGSMMLPMLAATVAATQSARTAVLVLAALVSLASLSAPALKAQQLGTSAKSPKPAAKPYTGHSVGRLLSEAGTASALQCEVVASGVQAVLAAMLPIYLVDTLGFPDTFVGIAIAACVAGNIVACELLQTEAMSIAMAQTNEHAPTAMLASVVLAVATAAIALPSTPTGMVVLGAAWGASRGLLSCAVSAQCMVGATDPAATKAALALAASGGALLQLASGLLVVQLGLSGTFWTLAIALALAATITGAVTALYGRGTATVAERRKLLGEDNPARDGAAPPLFANI